MKNILDIHKASDASSTPDVLNSSLRSSESSWTSATHLDSRFPKVVLRTMFPERNIPRRGTVQESGRLKRIYSRKTLKTHVTIYTLLTNKIDSLSFRKYNFFMKIKITIKDIANEAEVGVGTVSRVLNHSINISPKTRDKVMGVIKKYNYTPSSMATQLARKEVSRKCVGLVIYNYFIHFYSEVFEHLYNPLREKGIHLIVIDYEDDDNLINTILSANIYSLIFFAIIPEPDKLKLLQTRNIPYIFLESKVPNENYIYLDNYAGGQLAAKYLIKKGSTKPCFVHTNGNPLSDRDRFRGFSDYLQEQGISSPDSYYSDLNETSGYNIAFRILNDNRNDGIFCFCDEIAIGVLQALQSKEVSIPLIGYDGIRETRAWGLSTIAQSPQEIGKIAATTVINLMEHGSEQLSSSMCPIEEHIIPVLIDRDS